MTKSKELSSSVVKSAARVLEIFELFDEVRAPITINEVSEKLGYPHSSTTALLKSLDRLGYLEYEPDTKTFFPSVRISMLGHWVESESLPVRTVQSLMARILERTGCTVITAISSGLHAQYIKVLQGTAAIRYYVKPGTRRYLFECTLGRMLLAQMEQSSVRALVEEGVDSAQRLDVEVDDIIKDVRKISRQGYALNSGLVVPNGTLLAVPLRIDHRGRPAAVGIAAPQDQLIPRQKEFIELMRSEALHARTPEASLSLAGR
ncbi:MAG: IclR family transcriptional regulator [bacterium]